MTTSKTHLRTAATIALSGATMLAGLGGGLDPVHAAELSVVTGSPSGHVISQAVENWMACVEDAKIDDLSLRYYPAGQLSGLPELLQSLQSGVADFAPVPIGYVSDQMPLNGVAMLPGLGTSAGDVIGAYSAAFKEGNLAREYAANGIVPLWAMAFPPYQIVSMGDPIRSAADFDGKVIRSAGGSMNLAITALGGSPAEIPSSDMYVALERGTADGTISAPSSLKPYNVNELMKSISTNGAFGTFVNVFAVREDRWEAFSPEAQAIMTDCAAKTQDFIGGKMDDENDELLEEFAAAGVDTYAFTDEEKAAIEESLEAVEADWVERLAARGLPAQDVLDDYVARFGAQ